MGAHNGILGLPPPLVNLQNVGEGASWYHHEVASLAGLFY